MCAHPLADPGSVSSRAGRLKRDLLHTSFGGGGGGGGRGAKYAARQTPRSALERNPMHFIRVRVIQRDDSSVMAAVYSTTTLFATSHLWTQLDPEESLPPSLHPPAQPSVSVGVLSPSVDLTRLLSSSFASLPAIRMRNTEKGDDRRWYVCAA